MVLEAGDGDPLLATWRYGRGRVAAWTSDVSSALNGLSGRHQYDVELALSALSPGISICAKVPWTVRIVPIARPTRPS